MGRVQNVKQNCLPYLPENARVKVASAYDWRDSNTLIAFQKEHGLIFDKTYLDKVFLGAIGCTFSHIKAWHYQIQHSIPHMVVFEDDVFLSPDFNQKLAEVRNELPSNYEFTYLHFHKDHYRNDAGVQIPGKKFVNRCYSTWGTAAYLISLSGAKRFYKHFRKYPIGHNIDNLLRYIILKKYPELLFSSRYPLVIWAGAANHNTDENDEPKESAVENTLHSNIWNSPKSREIVHKMYQVQEKIIKNKNQKTKTKNQKPKTKTNKK